AREAALDDVVTTKNTHSSRMYSKFPAAPTTSSSSSNSESEPLPPSVVSLLNMRRRASIPLSEVSKSVILVPAEHDGELKTPLQIAFQRQVETLAIENHLLKGIGTGGGSGSKQSQMLMQKLPPDVLEKRDWTSLFDIKTYFDLRDYDLEHMRDNRHER
ncbi:unnamed protein product, partial [Amoebophrya sp. A25]